MNAWESSTENQARWQNLLVALVLKIGQIRFFRIDPSDKAKIWR
jgi:hypothetical protein